MYVIVSHLCYEELKLLNVDSDFKTIKLIYQMSSGMAVCNIQFSCCLYVQISGLIRGPKWIKY